MIANRGDKIICIGVGFCDFITIGKIYEVLGISMYGDYYLILSDDGETRREYPNRYFMALNEWREQQINKIL